MATAIYPKLNLVKIKYKKHKIVSIFWLRGTALFKDIIYIIDFQVLTAVQN